MVRGEPIRIFNHGDMQRDFTYIDDIIEGIMRIQACPPEKTEDSDPYRIYNIGNNHPVRLMDFIHILEKEMGCTAEKEYLPMQPGDVYQTYADISALQRDSDLHRIRLWKKDCAGLPGGINPITT